MEFMTIVWFYLVGAFLLTALLMFLKNFFGSILGTLFYMRDVRSMLSNVSKDNLTEIEVIRQTVIDSLKQATPLTSCFKWEAHMSQNKMEMFEKDFVFLKEHFACFNFLESFNLDFPTDSKSLVVVTWKLREGLTNDC